MPRKILNDNYILNKCPQYQPLGVPNALLPQVDKPPKLQGFKDVIPARPTSISATISDLANNVYSPVPLNSKQKAENLMKAEVRIAEQIAVEVDPMEIEAKEIDLLRALTLSYQTDIEDAIIAGDEELKEALRLSGQEARATVKVESVKNPVFEKNFKEMEERIKSAEERVRMSLEDMPVRREIILPVSEEEEKVEVEVEVERPVEERAIIELQKRRKEAMKRIRQEREEPEEMAGDRLAPRAVIKTKEIEVRPAEIRPVGEREFQRAEQIVKEFQEQRSKEGRRPRRIGLRGSMAEQLR